MPEQETPIPSLLLSRSFPQEALSRQRLAHEPDGSAFLQSNHDKAICTFSIGRRPLGEATKKMTDGQAADTMGRISRSSISAKAALASSRSKSIWSPNQKRSEVPK